MKNIFATLIIITGLTACAAPNDVSYWNGEPLAKLIQIYGTPSNFLSLADGQKVVEFDQHGDQCAVSFILNNKNQVISGNVSSPCLS